MNPWLLPIAALSMVSLTACGDAPNNNAAATVERQPDGSATMQIQVPESMVPAAEAIANPQQTLDNMSSQAASMTEQAKLDTVVNARRAAEAGARALGQTEAEITQAGDVAERSAKDALGIR